MKIPYKKLLHGTVFALCLLTLAIGGFVAWIAATPRSMPALSPYIEKALSPEGSPYRATVGETVLSWAGWTRPVDVQLRNVRLLTQSGASVASFPNTSLGLELPSLLIGKVVPRSITIRAPHIHLFKQEDGALALGFEDDGAGSAIPLRDTAALFASNGDNAPFRLRKLAIEQGDITIDTGDGMQLRAPDTVVSLKRRRGLLTGFLRMDIQEGEAHTPVIGSFNLNMESNILSSKLQVENLSPKFLASLLSDYPQLSGVDVALSGTFEAKGPVGDQLPDIAFNMQGASGHISDPEQFAEPLAVKHIDAKGAVAKNGSELRLDNLALEVGSTKLSLLGIFSRSEAGISAKGKAQLEHLPLDDIAVYWPNTVAPEAKGWVTRNIVTGVVKKGTASFDVTPETLAQLPRPKSLLDATLDVENANVTYLEGHPSVAGVNGTVHFTGNTIEVNASAGNTLTGSVLKKGVIVMPDLSQENPQMVMDFDIAGPARDVISYIDIPDLDFADPIGLSDKRITGDIDGTIHLDFPLRDSDDPGATLSAEHIKFDIKAALKDVSHPDVLGDLDIEKLNGDIRVTNPEFTLKGKGNINGIDTDLDLTHDFTGKQPFENRYVFKANIPTPKQKAFGYPDLPEVTGSMMMDADVQEKGGTQSFDVTIDFANADMNFKQYGWMKPKGKPATLKAKGEGRPGVPMQIKKLSLVADDMKASGSAVVAPNRQSLQSLTLDSFVSGANNMALAYEQKNGVTHVVAKGESADLSGYFDKDDSNYSRDQIPSIDLQAQFKKLILSKDEKREIDDFTAKLDCSALLCGAASATGKVDGTVFTYRLGKEGDARTLSLETKDAGGLIRVLGLSPSVTGGEMSLKGAFDDTKEGRPLKGSIEIHDYVLHDAPVLTKLLSLGSFTGFLDTLGGKGITFKKLSVPFVLKGDVLTLKDAKTYGPAIGIMADGTINLKGVDLDLEGTLVPSYTLNTVLGKIPVIGVLGDAIMGGEGKGLIAANYSVKGPYHDPKVSLNPLSILTPGFLRGLFDIFDSPADKEDTEEKPAEPIKPKR